MGRYLLYRMHPFSVGECLHIDIPADAVRPPAAIANVEWQALWEHGGFPEPFLRRDVRFTRRWRSLRHDQLTREDIRTVAQIQSLGALETLSHVLAERSAQQLFQKMTRAKHAFQAVIDLPHVQSDCFSRTDPTVVPARTLLSQLL